MAKLIPIVLILYGILGTILSITSIVFILSYNISLNSYVSPVQSEFLAMSKTMRDASGAAGNAGQTIKAAGDMLDAASKSSYSAGTAIYSVSSYVGFDILGWRPFEDTYYKFTTTGDDLQSLSQQISYTSYYLDQNSNDMYTLSNDFAEMAVKLEQVSWKFNGLGGSYWIIRRVAIGIAVYLALLHLMFLLVGIGLIRSGGKKR